MRVLFIANTLFRIGGAQIYAQSIAHHLETEGHEPYFLSINKKEPSVTAKPGRHFHLKFFDSKTNRYISRCFINIPLIIASYIVIRKIQPHVIYIQNTHHTNLSILLAIWLSNTPVIQIAHDFGTLSCPSMEGDTAFASACKDHLGLHCATHCVKPWYITEIFVYHAMRTLSNKILKCMIAPTYEIQKWLVSSGVKHVQYLPLFSPVSKKHFDIKERTGIFTFLFVGRITQIKGVHILIEAVALLVKRRSDFRVVLVGDGDQKNYLRNAVKAYRIENNISFEDECDNGCIEKYYLESNFVIVPSVCRENASLATLEAFSYAKPVIASATGALPEFVRHNVSGFLFKRGDPMDLCDKMEHALANKPLAHQLGIQAHELVTKEYSTEKHLEAITKILIKNKKDIP